MAIDVAILWLDVAKCILAFKHANERMLANRARRYSERQKAFRGLNGGNGSDAKRRSAGLRG